MDTYGHQGGYALNEDQRGLDPTEAMAVVRDERWRERTQSDADLAWEELKEIVSAECPDWDFSP